MRYLTAALAAAFALTGCSSKPGSVVTQQVLTSVLSGTAVVSKLKVTGIKEVELMRSQAWEVTFETKATVIKPVERRVKATGTAEDVLSWLAGGKKTFARGEDVNLKGTIVLMRQKGKGWVSMGFPGMKTG